VDKGLWANFATKSAEGAGPFTLADVAARPSTFGGSLATVALSDLARARHNVLVLIPSRAKDWQVLNQRYHVEALRTAASGQGGPGTTEVEHSDPRVAPINPTAFPVANATLATFPLQAEPALGTLRGKGFYVSKIAYELKGASPAAQSAIFSSFVGLIAYEGLFRAWMSGLWSGDYQQTLAQWGHRSNVVIGDGVDLGGFASAVIDRNGR
jgi:hypothetical protein